MKVSGDPTSSRAHGTTMGRWFVGQHGYFSATATPQGRGEARVVAQA